MADSGTILLADDEETFREATCRMLRREGYECEVAADADEALGMLGKRNFDLLIADIRMPRNAEMRLVTEARRIAGNIPMILVTGYPSLDTAIYSVGTSVNAYLTKPLDFKELMKHVRPAIENADNVRAQRTVVTRLRQCADELDDAVEADSTNGANETGVPVLTVRTLAACLSELLEIRSGQFPNEAKYRALCDLLDCPQQPFHRIAIKETIDVLQSTKSTFKSKVLAELRTKLECIVGD